MADTRRYHNDNYDYVDGNTVRKLNPAYEPQRTPERKPEIDPARREQIRRKREKANVIDGKYTVVIACACLVVFAACVGYLRTQAQINSQQAEIASLQTELNQLNNENVAKEEQLNSSVDLNAIYTTASKKLGMKYADSQHTILYESSDPDYVRQYQDIPDNK
jgi:cell division protein FtsL